MKRIKPGEAVRVELSEWDQTLLLEHTFADPEYADRLRPVPGKKTLVAEFTLDDPEDLLGFVAAEANHENNKAPQAELDDLYERLATIQESYDDGGCSGTESYGGSGT